MQIMRKTREDHESASDVSTVATQDRQSDASERIFELENWVATLDRMSGGMPVGVMMRDTGNFDIKHMNRLSTDTPKTLETYQPMRPVAPQMSLTPNVPKR